MIEKEYSTRRNYLPDILLFLSTVVWGLSFAVMKDILGVHVSVALFVFLRFSISSILLFIIGRKKIRSLGAGGIRAGVFLGFLVFIGFMTQTTGLVHTTASKSAFITGLSASFIPIFLLLHRRKLPEPLVIGAIALATLGMYMLTGPAGGGVNIGDFLTLLCAVAFGAQIYSMGLATSKYDSLGLTMVEILTTAVLAGLILPFDNLRLDFSARTISALIFMTVFATALALWVQTWAQKRISAVRAGLIYSAEPVFAYMFAFILLGERLNFIQSLGGIIIIIAILASELIPLITAQLSKRP